MRKYRLTKITVKTREIVSVSNNQADENQKDVCPVCHAPLSAPIADGTANGQQRPAELPAAKISDEDEK